MSWNVPSQQIKCLLHICSKRGRGAQVARKSDFPGNVLFDKIRVQQRGIRPMDVLCINQYPHRMCERHVLVTCRSIKCGALNNPGQHVGGQAWN
jgi:hypothetical protein